MLRFFVSSDKISNGGKKLLEECPGIYLIASGGVSGLDDVHQLEEINVPAVIAGKAIYEGRISLKDLENENLKLTC